MISSRKIHNKTIKLLIVEDNRIVQVALQEMLAQLGYKADIASDGKTALALYNSQYHLILMDIDLPDIDGITITKVIRTIEKDRHVPIVAMTSHHDERDYQEQFRLAGIDGCSEKPDMTQLQALINKYTPCYRA